MKTKIKIRNHTYVKKKCVVQSGWWYVESLILLNWFIYNTILGMHQTFDEFLPTYIWKMHQNNLKVKVLYSKGERYMNICVAIKFNMDEMMASHVEEGFVQY